MRWAIGVRSTGSVVRLVPRDLVVLVGRRRAFGSAASISNTISQQRTDIVVEERDCGLGSRRTLHPVSSRSSCTAVERRLRVGRIARLDDATRGELPHRPGTRRRSSRGGPRARGRRGE